MKSAIDSMGGVTGCQGVPVEINRTLAEESNKRKTLGVRVPRSLVLCKCFVDRCLSFCPFSFGHCVVCPSIY
jgi:hypothetical protein